MKFFIEPLTIMSGQKCPAILYEKWKNLFPLSHNNPTCYSCVCMAHYARWWQRQENIGNIQDRRSSSLAFTWDCTQAHSCGRISSWTVVIFVLLPRLTLPTEISPRILTLEIVRHNVQPQNIYYTMSWAYTYILSFTGSLFTLDAYMVVDIINTLCACKHFLFPRLQMYHELRVQLDGMPAEPRNVGLCLENDNRRNSVFYSTYGTHG